MKIYLIRHGRQSSKRCNVNVPLSPEGEVQAELLGKRLMNQNIDLLYTSDLIRAEETGRIANKYWKAKHRISSQLREISFGDMEGLTDQELAEKFHSFREEYSKMEADISYPGGESASDVIKRVMPVFQEIKESGYENVAVVTHGGVIRSIISAFLKMDPCRYRLLGKSLENCSITEVVYDSRKQFFFLERFNDYAHLEDDPKLLRINWSE